MSQTNLKRLTGRKCQCPACGECFSSTNAFDRHRKGQGMGRYCLDPKVAGMLIRERGTGTYWTMPMPDGVVFGGGA